MAVYDSDAGKLVVQIVYDGPERTGKTTNLEHLCTLFTRSRRSELFRGEVSAGRTLFLDWLQLDGGLVAGYPLRCHLISVPGQRVLSRRREFLIKRADAVVFVLNSTEGGLNEALPMWRTLQECSQTDVVTIVQANLQDMPGALHPDTIRARMQIGPHIPIVAAEAAQGKGVQQTVVLAIRATATSLENCLRVQDIESMAGSYEPGLELAQLMQQKESEITVEPLVPQDLAAVGGTQPSLLAPTTHPSGDGLTAKGSDSLAGVIVERFRSSGITQRPVSRVGRYRLHSPPPTALGVPPIAVDENQGPKTVPSGVDARHLRPTLPGRDLVEELVWPSKEGPELLRRFPTSGQVLLAPSGRGGFRLKGEHIFEVGPWCLRTRDSWCFCTLEQAQSTLRQLANWKTQLGCLQAPRTVLVVQEDFQGYWLWTICLSMPTLSRELQRAQDLESVQDLGLLLEVYARAVVRSLRLSLDKHMQLEFNPKSYGYTCREAFYLSDSFGPRRGDQEAIPCLLKLFDEYCEFPEALKHYLNAIVRESLSQLTISQRTELQLIANLEAYSPISKAGEQARKSLLTALGAE